MRASLALCHIKNAFLYEHCPDLFPQGFLTDVELYLWADYLDSINS